MKSIGADTLFLSVLMLLTALPDNINGENEHQTTIVTSTSSGVLKTNTGAPNIIPTNTTSKTANDSTPAPVPTIPSIRSSDPTDNQTKNGTEATTNVRNTTAQYRPANTPSTVLTTVNLTTLNLTHATSNDTEIKPTDGKIEDNSTADPKGVVNLPDVTSNIMPTGHKGATEGGTVPTSPPKTRKGIIIGVGCVLAAVVFIVLIFLYKMCQKKPPAAENREVKVSAQTKESVKLLSVKTATPYSDSKRMSSNQMESIEC